MMYLGRGLDGDAHSTVSSSCMKQAQTTAKTCPMTSLKMEAKFWTWLSARRLGVHECVAEQ